MKLLLALFLLNTTSCVVWAQKAETDKKEKTIEVAAPPKIDESDSNAVYTIVEQPPEYPGGYNKMRTDLSQYIIYPEKARKDSAQGTVYVQFVVRKDGSLSDIVAIKGVSEEIDSAVINAVKSFPSWIPGKQRGKPVNVRFVLPVKFSLKAPVQKTTPVKKDSTEVFTIVERVPEYPGGYEAMMKYIEKEVKYSKVSRRQGMEGIVWVLFVVDKDGSITDIGINRGVNKELDEEAMRIVKGMPNWKPGEQNYKPVRVRFNMPIKFTR